MGNHFKLVKVVRNIMFVIVYKTDVAVIFCILCPLTFCLHR